MKLEQLHVFKGQSGLQNPNAFIFFLLLILRKDWCKQHIFKVKFEMEVYSPLWAKFINIIVVLM